jgi:putative SOS response-associated peptidase YedK
MCGRFSRYADWQEVQRVWDAEIKDDLYKSYNVAPTQTAAVILDANPKEAVGARFGLIPHWAKEAKVGYSMINARAETIEEKPTFKKLLQTKRCIIPADGFYEWQKKGTDKQPFRIEYTKGIFGFAGLWDEWKGPDGKVIRTFTIITTTPNKLMSAIHDRMPVMLEPEQKDDWLINGDTKLLKAFDQRLLKAFPVSSLVNSPRNNGAELIVPVK